MENHRECFVGLMFGCSAAVLVLACDPQIASDEADERLVGAISADDDASEESSLVEPAGDDEPAEALPGLDIDELQSSEPVAAGPRACTKPNDCVEACDCVQGLCEPDGFGPPPPFDVCQTAPTRDCGSSIDCQSGCVCVAGICKDDGVGAVNPSCHLPPPDAFEMDDQWQQWKAYGAPQVHNFHHAGDEDWVAVYFGGAGKFRIRTQDLQWLTDTKLEVYRYIATGKGPLVGSHDDVGGLWSDPNSKSSRVDLTVPAGSAYLIRISNKTPASTYDSLYDFPTYTLNIHAL